MKNINIYKEILIIIFISALFAFMRYMFIYDSYDLIKNKMSEQECVDTVDSIGTYIEPLCISSKLTKYMYDNDLALFVDARDEESYNTEHIKGAINISYEDHASILDIEYIKESILYNEKECFETYCIGSDENVAFISGAENLEKYQNYIIYCDGKGCPHSYDLSVFLYENFSIKNIFYYEEGIPVWKKKGFPTE